MFTFKVKSIGACPLFFRGALGRYVDRRVKKIERARSEGYKLNRLDVDKSSASALPWVRETLLAA